MENHLAGGGVESETNRLPQMEGELSYFDENTMNEQTIQNNQLKRGDNGSPPPNSNTASCSTGSPTSFGGISSGDSGQMMKHEPSHTNLQSHTDSSQAWSVSVPGEYHASSSSNDPSAQNSKESEKRNNAALKLLVSNNVAGSIIGRAGQTISELQAQSAARIKLSQSGDYYPGTQDRVCLVQGQLSNVKSALRLLLERIYMLQEQQHLQHASWQPKQIPAVANVDGFDFIVRVLVPSSCCGMIIGKGGTNIKHMEEQSGVSSIRLSPKESSRKNTNSGSSPTGTSERVVTLNGPSMESCLKYTNMTTNYSQAAVQESYSKVSPSGRSVVTPNRQGQYGHYGQRRTNSSADVATQMMWDQRGAASRMPMDANRRDAIQPYGPVYEASAIFPQDIPQALPSQIRGGLPIASGMNTMYVLPSQTNQVSAPNQDLSMQLQDSLRLSTPAAPIDYASHPHHIPQSSNTDFTTQIIVPDTMIGSILGRGGRTLHELQVHSNTRIRISQRGEYVPGTRNRIVTIRGPTAQSVANAQYLMSQRMVIPPTAGMAQVPPSVQQHHRTDQSTSAPHHVELNQFEGRQQPHLENRGKDDHNAQEPSS